MSIALCTLCLNEAEFLRKSFEQHKDWPGMIAWVFVEAADPKYAEADPDMVSEDGLSTDGTTDILEDLRLLDTRVAVRHYGWMRDGNPAQAKTRGRDAYLEQLAKLHGLDAFVVIDADEFYTRKDQQLINDLILTGSKDVLCWRLPQRHLWRPPSIADSPLVFEVVGGYWAVPHTRVFRWRHGIRYKSDHNWPESDTYRPLAHRVDLSRSGQPPQCVHFGFARSERNRLVTNRYYQLRGEGMSDSRSMYVQCRAAWAGWRLGMGLPAGARVATYDGPMPECFMNAAAPASPSRLAPG